MRVIDYFESDKKEHWLNRIKSGDWRAAGFLYELLSKGAFFDAVGERSRVLLLTDGVELISFCTYAEKDEIPSTELSPWMGFVYTFPKYRGHHYMGILMEEIERLAMKDGVSEVYISTDHIGLYEKYGCVFRTEMNDRNGVPCRIYAKKIPTDALLTEPEDTEWPFEYTDHDRRIARAIVYDDAGYFYFVRAERNDDFGKATLIETPGGGIEPGEDPESAVRRELKEELGAEVEVVRKIGVVSDHYNLIHRHNLNHYFLCKVLSFGDRNLTQDEIEDFHLSTLRLTYEEAIAEYEKRRESRIGRLIANRELPVLKKARTFL
ncbi:MAG: GNAT family N-acetyltransferase [Lachnospiraceae bacterium]|nr:GNAT family N-acetyltransferase [Lachnospiraceae bacterium]